MLKRDGKTITFRVKDYRVGGAARYTTMTLGIHEFIRRFLLHVLPKGFHRIRHYGLLATGQRADNIEHARELLAADAPADAAGSEAAGAALPPCPCCGGRLVIIETFFTAQTPTHRPTIRPLVFKVDTS